MIKNKHMRGLALDLRLRASVVAWGILSHARKTLAMHSGTALDQVIARYAWIVSRNPTMTNREPL